MIVIILIAVLFGTSHDACVTHYPHRAPESGRWYFNTFDTLFERVGLKRNVAPGLLKASRGARRGSIHARFLPLARRG